MDWDHGSRIQSPDRARSFFGIECEADRTCDGEACRADMQDRHANVEATRDLLDSIEPDRIAGDVERAVFLACPFQNKSGGFANEDMTSQ